MSRKDKAVASYPLRKGDRQASLAQHETPLQRKQRLRREAKEAAEPCNCAEFEGRNCNKCSEFNWGDA